MKKNANRHVFQLLIGPAKKSNLNVSHLENKSNLSAKELHEIRRNISRRKQKIAFRGKNKILMDEVYKCLQRPDNSNNIDELNKTIENAINNQETRSIIISNIASHVESIFKDSKEANEEVRNEINAEWIYLWARNVLPGKYISDEAKNQYRIGLRRGVDGGFIRAPVVESPQAFDDIGNNGINNEDQIEEQIEKNLETQEKVEKDEKRLEKHFYPAVQNWAINNGFERCEITGGMLPGPKWENPDLIEIYAEVGKNTASVSIEVTCFEVKLKVDPYAIWQAAHYKKFSTYTFIAFALLENEVRLPRHKDIFELAVSLGLGILVLDNEKKFKAIHYPARHSPSISEIEVITGRFIEKFPNTVRSQINDERTKLAKLLFAGVNFSIA